MVQNQTQRLDGEGKLQRLHGFILVLLSSPSWLTWAGRTQVNPTCNPHSLARFRFSCGSPTWGRRDHWNLQTDLLWGGAAIRTTGFCQVLRQDLKRDPEVVLTELQLHTQIPGQNQEQNLGLFSPAELAWSS